MNKFFLCTLFFLAFSVSFAQQASFSSSEILQKIEKLNTLGSVLYIAAHPDDENTRLLAYLANDRKYRTGYLSLTRGDGGQNLIGKEQGSALGLIRTQELLAARRTDGAEQFFTRANDFGYSKNPEETFEIWKKDSVLADMVWVIRNFQPDVIICRFPTTGEGGHGHHTASAILAEEAFDAASDPNRFPEQLKTVSVWKTKRLFWNTFNFGSTNTTSEEQLKLDVGLYNPLLGEYYGEIAANSRSMHKSQGFGSSKTRGTSFEYFTQLKGEIAKTDPFEGIITTWNRLNETQKLESLGTELANSFAVRNPSSSLKKLVKLHQSLNEILAKNPSFNYWKTIKLKEIEDLIGLCSGLYVEANLNGPTFSPGDQTILTSTIISKYASDITVKSISFPDIDSTLNLALETNKLFSIKHPFKLSQSLPYSNPYWLNAQPQDGLYTVKNQKDIGVPENPAALNVKFNVSIAGSVFTFVRPVAFKSVDPVKGEIYRPVEILPQVTINSAEKVIVFTDKSPKKATFIVKAQSNNVKGSFRLDLPKGWSGTLNQTDFELLEKGTELSITATISASKTASNGSMKLFALVNNDTLSYSIQRIDYDHIPQQFILSESGVKLILVPMQSVGEKIAYIPGAGDDVAACLEQIGFSVTLLSEADLSNGNLAQYKSIITGVRAYNTNTRLTALHAKLMEYVKNGGNLIVQYNTNSRVGPIGAKIGPYPFTISRNRVTDEKAEVRFINPNHSVLNFPNKISTSDFENWIQERGIYFASELDSNYQTILAMNDPKEQDETGSLIVGQFGKGHFIYTGLAFFRELPAGVPGAYRLFVNLISIPNAK